MTLNEKRLILVVKSSKLNIQFIEYLTAELLTTFESIIKMPSGCIAKPLQRELADSIVRMANPDDLRILLACGAKVNETVTQVSFNVMSSLSRPQHFILVNTLCL